MQPCPIDVRFTSVPSFIRDVQDKVTSTDSAENQKQARKHQTRDTRENPQHRITFEYLLYFSFKRISIKVNIYQKFNNVHQLK